MSKALTTEQKGNLKTVSDLLERSRRQIMEALPKHLTAERVMRLALSELRNNENLMRCTPESLVSCIVRASQLGLEISSQLGRAYLVPYGDEATLIIGYRGLMDLARRSGEVVNIGAHPIRANDTFELWRDMDGEHFRHVPNLTDPGELVAVYSFAKLKDGTVSIEAMTRQQVDAIRKRSRASGSGPWVTDYDEMTRKTVLRRHCKYLPASVEVDEALASDIDSPDFSGEINVTPADTAIEALVTRRSAPVAEPAADTHQEPAAPPAPAEAPSWPRFSSDELVDSAGQVYDRTLHGWYAEVKEPSTNRKTGVFRARRGSATRTPPPAVEPEPDAPASDTPPTEPDDWSGISVGHLRSAARLAIARTSREDVLETLSSLGYAKADDVPAEARAEVLAALEALAPLGDAE